MINLITELANKYPITYTTREITHATAQELTRAGIDNTVKTDGIIYKIETYHGVYCLIRTGGQWSAQYYY